MGDRLFDAIQKSVELGEADGDLASRLWSEFGESAAVLVLDSTGFTKTTKSRGIVYFLRLIQQLRGVAIRHFKTYHALDCRTEADNLFASFDSVQQAVEAAQCIHAELENLALEVSEGELFGACIGVGFGRLLRSDHEGLYGDEMNLASKLGEDTAKRGETLLTEAALANLEDSAPYDLEERHMEIADVQIPYYSLTGKR